MADIRIKDLTTTASSTASDDFIAVDGTTNGTRKLSAFSPTFGGNATVTGTLTVNSGLTASGGLSCTTADVTTGYIILRGFGSQDGGLVFFGQSANNNFINSNATTISTSIAGNAVSNNVAAGFRVLTTTASTTTSTGALVVGNGTSGGLGVGGAITAGGGITSTNPGGVFQITGTGNTGASKELIFYRSDGGDTLNFGLTGTAYAGILTGLGNNEAYFYYSSSSAFRIFLGTAATQRYDFTANQFKINQTTASTTTSSGALVVSGGVGVAGAMNVGSQLKVTNSSIPDLWLQNTSGATSAYRNILIRQNSDDTFKFLSTSDAGVLSKDNILTGNNATGAIGIGVAPGSGTSSLTIAGNLAVSGTQNTFGLPSSASALGTNSTMTFELTSNTSLKIFVRGSDGTTRSTTLTLA